MGRSGASAAAGGVHGFPAALTSFIGRAGPAGEVMKLLGEYRLVTVTGPGGSGKTRLAGAVAGRVAGQFADGAWLAELAPVRDPAQLPTAVAAALGVPEQPGMPAGEVLARVLARQQLLLVLDNCEHLIDAAAKLCAGLLEAADDVRLLATSREPLAAAGEVRYRLGPLSLPVEDDLPGGSEAVTLFADRARRADARFALDRQTGPVVARLVRRLDGMPLAIELAAARVEALGVTQLLDRLDDRFALLTAGDRLAAGRHRSLAAAVDWSYQLLGEDEQRVFRRLSVFPAGFTLKAAEAVAGDGAGPVVLRLVDCSLLVPPRAGPDGRSRYQMLETLRAYGAGLLAQAGEQDEAAAALARYAQRVAEQASAGLQASAGEVAAASWLGAEEATMRQVMAWAREHDAAAGLQLAFALAWWWTLQGRLAGQYPLLRELAGHAKAGSDQWRTAQFWLGWAAQFSADPTGALDHFTVLRDAAAGLAPGRALADALTGRAAALLSMARYAEAAEDAGRAVAAARDAGDPVDEVVALTVLSYTATYGGDHDRAVWLARQAEQLTAAIPGSVARTCSWVLSEVLTEAGDLTAARHVCQAGLARTRETGDLYNLPVLLTRLARLDLQAGRLEQAAADLHETFQVTLRVGVHIELLNAMDCCGHLCAATGRPADAVTMWAAWVAHHRREGDPEMRLHDQRREQPLSQAHQVLGSERTRAAEDRGAAMSLETAAEYGLMLTTPGPPQPAAPGPGKLSAREQELVALVARGCTDAQIAAQLYISIRTVRSHLDRIRDKTDARRRADLTRLALSTGLV